MKRRQHVGKKRAKVRARRKSRRDTVKGVARVALEAGKVVSVTVGSGGGSHTMSEAQPEFTPGTEIRSRALVSDKWGKLWFVDPEAQRIAPAKVRY